MNKRKKELLKKIFKSKKFADLPSDVKDALIEDLDQESENKFYIIMTVITSIAVIVVIGMILYYTHSLSDTVIGGICAVIVVVVVVVATGSAEGVANIIKHIFNKS